MSEIKPNFCDELRYTDTLFCSLRIYDFRSTSFGVGEHDVGRVVVSLDTRLKKSDGSPDWRYNSIHEQWRIDEFISMLEKVASAGDLTDLNLEEKNELFVRKIDSLVPASARLGKIYLSSWSAEPIYSAGCVRDFIDAIESLKLVRQALLDTRL